MQVTETKRVIVIGCPGSGKSVFSRALQKKTGLPLYHLDLMFWNEDRTTVPKEEFRRRLSAVLQTPEWIIDGNYSRTIPMRLEKCDTVFYLDYPRLVCFFGVVRRVLGSLGKTRPDMAEGCPERFDLEFLQYTWKFRKKQRAGILALLEGANAEIHIFRSRKEAKRYLDGMEKV